MIRSLSSLIFLLLLAGCAPNNEHDLEGLKIAFMPDVHFHQVYGNFSDTDVEIIRCPTTNENVTIRTMHSQLTSTRLFNENYFAFIAALEDLAGRGIKYVALPGDFSDNGQPRSVKGVKKLLDEYSQKHGIQFFLITGNHDPSRPYLSESGQRDYLGRDGRRQPIMSKAGMYTSTREHELPVIVTSDLQNLGYREITSIMKNYGFFPQENYLYWETPFSSYNTSGYNFQKALEESALENRMYTINPHSMRVPDVSYLAEPVEGLWLLAIDGNVYIPREEVSDNNEDASNYSGTGLGYNNVINHKKHIIGWVTSVAEKAEKLGKTLIAFSHYPMVEFCNDASPVIKNLFGENKMQMGRMPSEEIAQIFSDAGIGIHFAGHMHINDTGIRRSKEGNTLFNIQVPSLGAYMPAYKILTIKDEGLFEIETITLDSVPRFNELFDFYRVEHDYLRELESQYLWNIDILSSSNYHEFTTWHMKELIRLRFLPADWPADFLKFLSEMNGQDMFIISQLDDDDFYRLDHNSIREKLTTKNEKWHQAAEKARMLAWENDFELEDFKDWDGFDLILDFYRLKNADELAFNDVGDTRLQQYYFLNNFFQAKTDNLNLSPEINNVAGETENLADLLHLISEFADGAPSNHFIINVKTGEIENLSGRSVEKSDFVIIFDN